MLTWMIYAVSVSAVPSIAALIAEHSARQRRSPGRWFWLLTIVASLAIPAVTTLVSIATTQVCHRGRLRRQSPDGWTQAYCVWRNTDRSRREAIAICRISSWHVRVQIISRATSKTDATETG